MVARAVLYWASISITLQGMRHLASILSSLGDGLIEAFRTGVFVPLSVCLAHHSLPVCVTIICLLSHHCMHTIVWLLSQYTLAVSLLSARLVTLWLQRLTELTDRID